MAETRPHRRHTRHLPARPAQSLLNKSSTTRKHHVPLPCGTPYPNAAWHALPAAQRQQFLGHIDSALALLSSLGVEVLSLAETDPCIDQDSAHRFLGIWRFPTLAARGTWLASIQASGWYGYFDHVNAASTAGHADNHLAALAAV